MTTVPSDLAHELKSPSHFMLAEASQLDEDERAQADLGDGWTATAVLASMSPIGTTSSAGAWRRRWTAPLSRDRVSQHGVSNDERRDADRTQLRRCAPGSRSGTRRASSLSSTS
ncbi:MAG: hypothetical protein R3A10_05320 [Caldilineaceae bacterium]